MPASYTYRLKAMVLADYEKSGLSQRKYSESRGIPLSSFRGWLAAKDEILSCNQANQASGKEVQRKRRRDKPEVENQLVIWVREAEQQEGTLLSNAILKSKCEEIARDLNEEFECTARWIDRFKRRHNIVLKKAGKSDELPQTSHAGNLEDQPTKQKLQKYKNPIFTHQKPTTSVAADAQKKSPQVTESELESESESSEKKDHDADNNIRQELHIEMKYPPNAMINPDSQQLPDFETFDHKEVTKSFEYLKRFLDRMGDKESYEQLEKIQEKVGAVEH